MPGQSTLQLDYGDLQVAVSADREADLHWLLDFLGPGWRRRDSPPEQPGPRVGLHADPAWERRRRSWQEQEASEPPGSVVAHILDGMEHRLPYRRQSDGTFLGWDALFECFYRWDAPGGPITLLQAEGPPRPRRARFALMRAVREYALHHEWRRGALALHAAGVVRDGRALLFAGPRRAGKTTLLSACLSLVPDLELLANDRILLSRGDGGWSCRGMATVVSVRPGDEALLPGLRQRLHAQAGGAETGRDEPAARSFAVEDRLLLSPAQYSRSLGVSIAAEARLVGIILPGMDAGIRGMRWHALDERAATETLSEALFGAAHRESRSQLFDSPASGPFPGEAERAELVQRLAREHPCWSLALGPDAYCKDGLQDLIDTLLATSLPKHD